VDFTEPWLLEAPSVGNWEHFHNEVAEELAAAVQRHAGKEGKLLSGFLEIANFMLKNTTGIGSNIRLAECEVSGLPKEAIYKYYTWVLTLLAFHGGRLLPQKAQSLMNAVIAVSGDAVTCRAFVEELEACKDHQDGEFSSVRAGRKLWEHVAQLLCIKNAESNVTGRIYYQTAPAQDLLFVLEKDSPSIKSVLTD
jgi:hypothetical protein